MAHTLNTPLILLRKAAPGSLRQQDIADAMRREGLEIATITVGDFERGKYLPADERFVRLYAEIVRSSQRAVREAYERTRSGLRTPSRTSPRRRLASRS